MINNFWGQYNEECSEIGDVNFDSIISIHDIISLINCILDTFDGCNECHDITDDGFVDVIDIVELVNIILDN